MLLCLFWLAASRYVCKRPEKWSDWTNRSCELPRSEWKWHYDTTKSKAFFGVLASQAIYPSFLSVLLCWWPVGHFKLSEKCMDTPDIAYLLNHNIRVSKNTLANDTLVMFKQGSASSRLLCPQFMITKLTPARFIFGPSRTQRENNSLCKCFISNLNCYLYFSLATKRLSQSDMFSLSLAFLQVLQLLLAGPRCAWWTDWQH